MDRTDDLGSGEMEREFFCHAYLRRRAAAAQQRWYDDFFGEYYPYASAGSFDELVKAVQEGDKPRQGEILRSWGIR